MLAYSQHCPLHKLLFHTTIKYSSCENLLFLSDCPSDKHWQSQNCGIMGLLVTSFLFVFVLLSSVFVSYTFIYFSFVENSEPVRLTLLRVHSLLYVQSLLTLTTLFHCSVLLRFRFRGKGSLAFTWLFSKLMKYQISVVYGT